MNGADIQAISRAARMLAKDGDDARQPDALDVASDLFRIAANAARELGGKYRAQEPAQKAVPPGTYKVRLGSFETLAKGVKLEFHGVATPAAHVQRVGRGTRRKPIGTATLRADVSANVIMHDGAGYHRNVIIEQKRDHGISVGASGGAALIVRESSVDRAIERILQEVARIGKDYRGGAFWRVEHQAQERRAPWHWAEPCVRECSIAAGSRKAFMDTLAATLRNFISLA
ncbi:hypothetical protein [Rhizobium phage RHph_X2_26]|nr:hypothetical protein [Rhizobium phage RHph_X2_26]